MSLKTCIIYRFSLEHIDKAMYLISIVNVVTNFYLRNIYAIDFSLILNTYLKINFRFNLSTI